MQTEVNTVEVHTMEEIEQNLDVEQETGFMGF